MVLAVTTSEALDVVLIIFLIVVGLAVGYAFWRLGVLFSQLRTTVQHTEEEVLPVINKTGGTLDRVNKELDKVDVMTDSAVDAVTAVDRAVRAVSAVVTAPVQALAGLAAAIRHGVSSFVTHHDVEQAVQTAKDAGTRRMEDLAEELDQAGRRHSSGAR
jgi:predicted PurR-regulated permease PerM